MILRMGLDDLQEVLSISASYTLNLWTEKMFLEEMNNPTSHCFVAKLKRGNDLSVIGFICFRNLGSETELLHLCVHPKYRRQGVGKRLMQYYMDFCIQRGIRTYYLEVDPSNEPALHLYKGFSYKPLSVRKDFYQGGREGLVMGKEIMEG